MKTTLLPTIAKPFLKWAGGKTQLLDEIDNHLPKQDFLSGEIDTYVEPFLGGAAVFFHIAQKYPELKHFYLFDVNQDLVNCYNTVKHDVDAVIRELKSLQTQFLDKDPVAQKQYYYSIRAEFNSDRSPAKLIFLNKTCFNGLYRVNKKDRFNVPCGAYLKPTIYHEENLQSVAALLQNADILCDDFERSSEYINNRTFVYLDPPYRPLSPTASFTSYAKNDFTETDQIRLARFCQQISKSGAKFLLSNSDPKNEDPNDHFFEDHYKQFPMHTVKATRAINCKATGRGQINELLITNY